MKKPPLVVVTWIDARDVPGESVEYDLEKIKAVARLILRETSGFLVYQDDERTVLAHDYDAEEDPPEVGNFTVIPSGWVKKMQYIHKPRKKAPEAP